MNARKSVRQVLSVSLLLLSLGILLSSCGGKKDEPNPSTGGEQKLEIMDLRYDVDIQASSPIDVSFIATKGFEPNIYRDGHLLSQGNYLGGGNPDRGIQSLKTSFTHKGSAFVFSVSMDRPYDDNQTSGIDVVLSVKTYKNSKLLQAFNKKYNLSKDNYSASAQFELWGKSE